MNVKLQVIDCSDCYQIAAMREAKTIDGKSCWVTWLWYGKEGGLWPATARRAPKIATFETHKDATDVAEGLVPFDIVGAML